VIDAFMAGDTHAVFEATKHRDCLPQFRKILELIAFSSLIANVKEYSQQYDKFAEHWNARLMLRDLERVNATLSSPDHSRAAVRARESQCAVGSPGRLPHQRSFIGVYEKCGGLMHAENPYASPMDYGYYKQQLVPWRKQIINLLNRPHRTLSGDSNLYLFQMGADDKSPTYHRLA